MSTSANAIPLCVRCGGSCAIIDPHCRWTSMNDLCVRCYVADLLATIADRDAEIARLKAALEVKAA